MAADTRLRRSLPSLDALLRTDAGVRASRSLGRPVLKQALERVLDDARRAAARGVAPPDAEVLLARAAQLASRTATGLVAVVNATGVVLHTGLGRAPLPASAVDAAADAAGYADVEVDRTTGARGNRSARAELLLTALTGAPGALVVNNGAAALLLVVAALARRKEVLVSRGELIEIGGGFRIPEILAAAGAKLVEIGTTNRTRVEDYRAALSPRTALVLKVHPSNYRVVGFTAEAAAGPLADAAHESGVTFAYDLGSGLLDRIPDVPPDEPTARQALADGADIVTFSGDKLLGGPQAGIVLGRVDLVRKLRAHPMARALRVDKMQIAALERILLEYATGRHLGLPVWRMIRESPEDVRRRAAQLAEQVDEKASVVSSEAAVGGGSVPGHALASWAVAIRSPDAAALAARLRTGTPAVFCRVSDDAVMFDLRTVDAEQVADLARAIRYALEGDEHAPNATRRS
jgi:L-seryl-tRNA(Ser) seleniumtransferase